MLDVVPRALFISPHFPPVNAADHQRVRMLLPYMRERGWDAEVLAVKPECVSAPRDNWLAAGVPEDIPIHRVGALSLKWSRVPGFNSLTPRAFRFIRARGNALLQEKKFDLVYFSTTQFGLHVLGPRWKKKFGVPFLMDYQDPWVSDYYRLHPEITPPGGRLKYAIASWRHRRDEPRVLRQCSGITGVSADYPRQLAQRYPWLKIEDWTSNLHSPTPDVRRPSSGGRSPLSSLHSLPALTIPFPGDERDFVRVRNEGVRQNIFLPDGKVHWVYIGRCSWDMHLALRSFFHALKQQISVVPALETELKVHFIGTSYAPVGRGINAVEPVAVEFGLEKTICEHLERIPFAETLKCLSDADGLITIGSDDPAYTASKIYPYILARKPLLSIFHEQSSVVDVLNKTKAGTVVSFKSGESPESIAARIQSSGWLDQWSWSGDQTTDVGGQKPVVAAPATDWEAFAPYTAREMTRKLCAMFDKVIQNRGSES